MSAQRQRSTEEFFVQHHPVFSLDEAAEKLAPEGGRKAVLERLKYHVKTGRLQRVAREIYAVRPKGFQPDGRWRFQPDMFLVAAAARPDAVFSHHSALELLGAGHSTWHQVTVYCDRRRAPLTLDAARIRFLSHPKPMLESGDPDFGTRKVERKGRLLRVTGPERTLVEGFQRLDLVGGAAELVKSAGGFPTLDLEALEEVLRRYDMVKLWAAVGWFLEQHQQTFHVPNDYLRRFESRRPRSPLYLARGQRGGSLDSRWNIILPHEIEHMNDPDERES